MMTNLNKDITKVQFGRQVHFGELLTGIWVMCYHQSRKDQSISKAYPSLGASTGKLRPETPCTD